NLLLCKCQRPVGKVGSERAGFDNEHANTQGLAFSGQSLGKTLYSPFGGGIIATTAAAAYTGYGGQIDDGSRTLRSHQRQNRFRHADKAKKIDVKLVVNFVVAGLFDCADKAITRIIH